MSIQIPSQIISRVRLLLEQYDIESKSTLIAFSGGKDSLLLSLILKELGFKTLAIYINMGFPNSNNQIQYILEIAKQYDIEIEIFNVSNDGTQIVLPENIKNEINKRLDILFKKSQFEDNRYTPCTHCHNVKFLVLQHLSDIYNMEYIALGHHGTDAVVSLLKSALMYIDRHDRNHETFDRNNFEQLILELFNAKDIVSDIVLRINELTRQNYAGTDEPPVKIIDYNGKKLKIIKPLFNIFEHEIKKIYANTAITFKDDGCEHSVKLMSTPREMIHNKLLGADSAMNPDIVQYFHKLIIDTLSKDGTVKFDVRNNRNKLLGTRYKYSSFGETKL